MKKNSAKKHGKIRPLGDRILIEEHTDDKEKKTSSGIIIPAGVSEDKGGKQGKVVAVGSGRTENGKVISPSVNVGDQVIFQWGDKIKVDEKEFYIVRESEILAILN